MDKLISTHKKLIRNKNDLRKFQIKVNHCLKAIDKYYVKTLY